VLFELADEGAKPNPLIDAIFNNMPASENETAFIPAGTTLDFNQIIPSERSYITYPGSLTTPPCTEGILWHVMVSTMKVTQEQLLKFELATGDINCPEDDKVEVPTVIKKLQLHSLDLSNCTKLANGANYRAVQAKKNRPLHLYLAEQLCPVPPALGALSAIKPAANGGKLSVQQYQLLRSAKLTAPSKGDCKGQKGPKPPAKTVEARG